MDVHLGRDAISAGWGLTLRNWRRRANLTQTELADRIGSHQVQVSAVETGKRTPSWSFIMRCAEALGEDLNVTVGPMEAEVAELYLRLPEDQRDIVLRMLQALVGTKS